MVTVPTATGSDGVTRHDAAARTLLKSDGTAVDWDAPAETRTAAPSASATATILSGQSITDAIDLGANRLHRLITPTAWTAAAITFQSSDDGVSYRDLYTVAVDGTATEVSIASAGIPTAAARSFVLDPVVFLGVRYLKVRSGTSAAAVNQGADRTLTLVTVPR